MFCIWCKLHWIVSNDSIDIGSHWLEVIIGSGLNGLVPNRQQAIILTNDNLIHWDITRPLHVNNQESLKKIISN